jgi:hypothetical protein
MALLHPSRLSLPALALAAAFSAVGGGLAAEEVQAAAKPGAAAASSWVLGIARFSGADLPLESFPLADVLPRLVAAELGVLPDHLRSADDAAAAAELAAARSRLQYGADLAARLDERAARFFDPSVPAEARYSELASADKKVEEAAAKLEPDDAGSPAAAPSPPGPGERPVAAKLWEGNGRGELIDDPASSPAAAAKAKGVDLLVYGSVSPLADYTLVLVYGYDSALDRTVFSWKGFCSPEDPAPLAKELASKLERWTAGREFARLDVAVEPRSAIVLVDKHRLDPGAPSVYRYGPGLVRVEAAAAGYTAAAADVDLALGERRSVSLTLEPRVLGAASIETDPPDAKLLVDSVPVAVAEGAPLSLPLSGRREIVAAYAPGRESALVPLPASGEASIRIELKPDDGLGAAGRVEKAKDEFYKAFGWFFLSLPVSVLSAGTLSVYSEAAVRSLDSGLISSYYASQVVTGAAVAVSAGLAANMIVRLVRYLRTAR